MKEQALDLFAPLGPTYDRYASLLSFGQDPRWRSFLVSRMDVGPDDAVLDVATGTARCSWRDEGASTPPASATESS